MSNDAEDRLNAAVKTRFEASVPKYYRHTLKVVETMKSFLLGSPPNAQELVAAAYLHDIGYSLPYGDGFVGQLEDQSIKIPLHCEQGALLAAQILSGLGWEKKVVDRVAYLVLNHHRKDVADPGLMLLLRADEV